MIKYSRGFPNSEGHSGFIVNYFQIIVVSFIAFKRNFLTDVGRKRSLPTLLDEKMEARWQLPLVTVVGANLHPKKKYYMSAPKNGANTLLFVV